VRRSALVAGTVGLALLSSLSGGYAFGATVELSNELVFMDNNGEENARLCEEQIPSDASARLVYQQGDGQTWLRINVDKARPNALFTVWVILADLSPLTGVDATPMVPSDLVDELVPVTPPVGFPIEDFGLQSPPFQAGDGDTRVYMDTTGPTGPGFGTRTVVPNGFYTDRFGRGMFEVHLDFELVGGAYPFDRVEIPDRVEPNDFPAVPINANPIFVIASHCKDEKGHGLVFRANNETGDQLWFFFRGD